MEWSNVASLALVQEYKNQPVLWNNKHNHYYSKQKKQEAWEAVAYAMRMEVDDVKQKMNSLLGSFRRERSKMRRGRGRCGARNYYSRWFAFNSMQFLLDRNEEGPTDKIYLEELQVKLEEDDYDDLALDSDSNHLLEEELNDAMHETSTTGTKRSEKAHLNLVPPAKRAKIKYLPGPPIDALTNFLVQDECVTYANYVASKLQRFSDATRSYVEYAINKILFQADMGKYDVKGEAAERELNSHLDGIADSKSLNIGQPLQMADATPTTTDTFLEK